MSTMDDKKTDAAVAHGALAHHITAVNIARQQRLDDTPLFTTGMAPVRIDQVSWLVTSRDPAFNVVQTMSTEVGVPALPGTLATKSATAEAPGPGISSAFSLSSLASALSEKFQPIKEYLRYADPEQPGAGFFGQSFNRGFHTSKAIEPVILDLVRRSGCHPPYDAWRIQVSGSTDNIAKNVLEMLVSTGDVVLFQHLILCFPVTLESGFPPGVTPLLLDCEGEFIVLKTLENLLSGWHSSLWGQKGLRKPRLIYMRTVRATEEQRSSLYAILQKHDLILVEMDKDHFISAQAGRNAVAASRHILTRRMIYLEELRGQTMLERDVDGRVIHVDSLTSATDLNCGLSWLTCNTLFHRHLERIQKQRANSELGVPEYIIANTISSNWQGADGLLDRFISVSAEIAGRAAICMTIIASHYRLEEVTPPLAEPAYRCFSRRSTAIPVHEKAAPLGGAVSPLLTVYTRPSGLIIIVTIHWETHWKLANLSRRDLKYTQVSRDLAQNLHRHLMAKSIFVMPIVQVRGLLSSASDKEPIQEELEAHFQPGLGSRPMHLTPNPIGYVPEDRPSTGSFGLCTIARPIAEVEKSVKRLCEEIEAFFLVV